MVVLHGSGSIVWHICSHNLNVNIVSKHIIASELLISKLLYLS